MLQPTDDELMELIKEGDTMAFTMLVGRYKKPIVNFAYRILRDPHIAEDIAQETFFNLFRSVKSYHKQAKFSTYLFRLANNSCIDYLRKERKQDKLQVVVSPKDYALNSLDQNIANREISQIIQQTISSLPLNQRQAIILKEYHNLSSIEIAEIMDCPPDTVRTWIRRARQILKEKLTPLIEKETI
jgi:RNA polymerase sigma-70 factor (ECF subfamily)